MNSGLSCDQRRPSDLSPLSPGHANGRSVVCWEPLMMAYHTAGPPKSSFTSLMVTFPSTPLFKLKKKKKKRTLSKQQEASQMQSLSLSEQANHSLALKMTANNFLPIFLISISLSFPLAQGGTLSPHPEWTRGQTSLSTLRVQAVCPNITLFYRGSVVKNLPMMQASWFNPWVGKIPWRRE